LEVHLRFVQIGADVLAEQLEDLRLPDYHGEIGSIWLNVSNIGCKGLVIRDVRHVLNVINDGQLLFIF
jgi:hypothetical protein